MGVGCGVGVGVGCGVGHPARETSDASWVAQSESEPDTGVNRCGRGNELMNGAALTISGNAGGLFGDGTGTPGISRTPGAENLTQTVDVHGGGGTFTVKVGATLATFVFTAGESADTFRDSLIAAIRSVATTRGAMALTRILSAANCAAADRVMASTPPLLTE